MTRHALLLGACLVLAGSAPLYGWGSATHAYIARELGNQQGPTSLTELYGALLPDAFNVMFGDPYQGENPWRPAPSGDQVVSSI